ncbi:MAG TPA: hypothetical protein VGV60_18225, partial [Candidatus Polarisedimenticolia bacterium]|nr:hypothetical protein [Candidatus Polarisedimenticolia bacterium]
MRRTAGNSFVADEQVQPAIAVEVEPDSGLRRMKRKHARGFRDVFERAVAIVSQKGIRVPALFLHPRATQDKHVHMAVVVIV